eukprot:TRINITY_DN9878_c0_g1_i1.p1 TRINITY_DN9878_c0_g1~~TRINITY_DN9878_c0_g1_i1.p1  ORF type:complete len:185 (-),score=32.69 TRINITY_DN9878_c0_g1_i1:664-1218(-)
MEKDANGQPLRRFLMCGFLESLPAVENNDEDAYLPLGTFSQVLLSQARSADTDYIANHDMGDASICATPGVTNDDGLDDDDGGQAGGTQDVSRPDLAATSVNTSGAAPTPHALPQPTPASHRRRPKATTLTAATATTRHKKPRMPNKMKRSYTLEELVLVFVSELRVAVNLYARMGVDDKLEGG